MTYVFVPTTPNPTSGFLLLVREDEIQRLDVSVGDGMKMLISAVQWFPQFPENRNFVRFQGIIRHRSFERADR